MESGKDSLRDSLGDSLRGSLSGTLAVLLSWSLCLPTPLAVASPGSGSADQKQTESRPAYQSSQLQGDDRILHALNRFTFGPRSGDLAGVRAVGLEKWFDRELHPASIDQSDLNTRLAKFPAMQWGTQDLLYRLPSNALVRQAMAGQVPIPQSGILHAIYENQIYRFQEKKEEKAEKSTAANGAQGNSNPAVAAQPGIMNNSMDAQGSTAASVPMPDPNEMALAAKMDMLDDPAPEAQRFASLLALPPQQRLAKLASLQPEEFDSFSKSLKNPQKLLLVADMTPDQREAATALENPERVVGEEVMAERLTRDIYSNAQLQEVMTDFWLNHFNIYIAKDPQMPYYLASYVRDVIRPLALGKFEDLLESVAHSPAMLLYLDNATSIGPKSLAAQRANLVAARRPGGTRPKPEGLNENYARELMELHTLGVNGGYTQADVTQVARVLTGWTVDRPVRGGGFQFNANRHEPGTKVVLGQKIKEHGELEGRELLHMLASRPATAQFLSRELAIRFVSDNPPQSLVDRMAKAYMSSGGDIPTVLKTLFHSPEFWTASDDRAKVKTPLEFVVSAFRASDADVENFQPLLNSLRQMGMPLYGCIPPTGYNWEASRWRSTGSLVDRMNFALSLAANSLPGITIAWAPQSEDSNFDSASTPAPAAEEARLEPMLIPSGVSVSTRSAALQQFQAQIAQGNASPRPLAAARIMNRPNTPTPLEKEDRLLAGLLIGSPEFQRR